MGQIGSIPLFRVFGIRLELHLTFFLILLYAAWAGARVDGVAGAAWSLLLVSLLFVSVVLHELGHSLTARIYGIQTHRILLLPIGGMAQLEEMPRQPWREFFITLAGPAVNIVIAFLIGLPLVLAGSFPQSEAAWLSVFQNYSLHSLALTMLAYNIVMAVFNLIPVFPMDGGRIFRSLLAMKLPYHRATQVAAWVAKPLAITGALWALLGPGHILLAFLFVFIYLAGDMEYRMVDRQERLRHHPVGDLTARFVRMVPSDFPLAEALRLMQLEQPQELVMHTTDGRVRIITRSDLRQAATHQPHSTPLNALPLKPSIHLQASWPMDILAKDLAHRREDRFPVYDGDIFIGVLRREALTEAAEWDRLRSTTPKLAPRSARGFFRQ